MDFLQSLAQRPLVLDGAMGSELMRRGCGVGQCPDEWSVSHPDVVAAIHAEYYAAGSDIVQTNTFGATRVKLAAHGLHDRTAEINLAAAKLLVEVRNLKAPGRLVAGDVSSTGKFLKPMGELEPDELRDVFAEQVAALVEGGVDLLSIETMFDLAEARLAVEGVRTVTGLPVIASLTYKHTPKGYRTMMGVTPKQAVETLLAAGAEVVGCNCSIEAEEMIGLVGELRAAGEMPIVAQPNAGQPRLVDGETVYEETVEHFAATVPELIRQGANVVGGCCGTTPAYIAALVAALRASG
jgi:5-methyltetrahydrofolate--homocysteine methyltransferase